MGVRRSGLRRVMGAGTVAVLLCGLRVWAQSPIVNTQYGFVQGASADTNGVTAFEGIRYAAPPVGDLRWKAPQPAPAIAGVETATAFGNVCISADPVSPDTSDETQPQSEDCLTLNVWSPSVSATAAKPVMVWIHGGGFQFGSSADPTYNGALLATKDVVVVSMNYRLGVFGFFATDSLDAEAGTSGAYGFLDQIAALKWVKANIRQFGGDPDRVTIFGESAGAHSVGILLASPLAKGLFSSAIIESGAFWDTDQGSIFSHAEALALGAQLGAKFPGQDLRSVPAEILNLATPYNNVTNAQINNFSPSIDGQVLTEAPGAVFQRAEELSVPLLGGWNEAEYVPFIPLAFLATPSSLFYAQAANLFGQRCMATFMDLYPEAGPATAEPSALQLDGDLVIAQQTWAALELHARRNKVFAYKFTYTSPTSPIAGHTDEVPFVFGTMHDASAPSVPGLTAGDLAISNTMMSYWANFAHTGDPNGPGLPEWPVYKNAASNIMLLSPSTGAAANPDVARFQFIESYRSRGVLPAPWRKLGVGYDDPYTGVGCSQ